MLEAHDADESPLDDDAPGNAFREKLASESDLAAPTMIGRRFGSYRLVDVINVGGMGTVYLARRIDDPDTRPVAIKLLRGYLGKETQEQFARERRALAQVEHPNIARLIDGGRTAGGSPYLVMEYVRGEPIDWWCRGRSVSERLAIFKKVCAAVHHAHRSLVIHRDIKPSNVLVSIDGEPKLLDFGIAKILEPDAEVTATTRRFFTPQFASPEQVSGERVTTSSDVYSLGVLLFVLLTGKKPFDAGTGSTHELVRRICEEEPPRPSAVAPPDLRRRLAGDLDNIVLKALRKEPELRYPSADELSADLQRHLDGRPVEARKPTAAYRFVKFVRRNRAACAAGLVAILAAIGGVAATSVQAGKAERAASVSHEAIEVMSLLLSALDPNRRAEISAVDARDRVTRAEALLRDADFDALDAGFRIELLSSLVELCIGLELEDRKRHWARELLELEEEALTADDPKYALDRIAYGTVGLPLEEQLELRRTLHEELSATFAAPHEVLAESLRSLGGAQRSVRLYEQAVESHAQAVATARALDPPQPRVLVNCLNYYGARLWDLDRYAEAEVILREATQTVTEAGVGDSYESVRAWSLLGSFYQDRARFDEAHEAWGKAIQILRRLLPADHPGLAVAVSEHALLLKDMRRYDEALVAAREALENADRYGAIFYRSIQARINLAKVLADRGDYGEAESVAEEAVEMMRDEERDWPIRLPVTLTLLGRVRNFLGKHAQAVPPLEEAIALQERFGQTDWEAAKTRSILGDALSNVGELDRAEALLLESFDVIAADRGEDHHRTVEAAERVIAHFERRGMSAEAARWREKL